MAKKKGWGIEILNLQESLTAFDDASECFGATPLKECLMPIAERIRDYAKTLVRLGSGRKPSGESRPHLRDLIFATGGREDESSVIVGVDRKKAPHAHLVEFGHGGPHPSPPYAFLRPAFDMFRRAAVDLMGREINERIIKKITTGNRRDLERAAREARRAFSTKI